ncbi:MAG: hypothetical protein HW397_527 [Dehalococcoidia bacterium]|nr:hypothetical protein [Dehalococcoidia bacterium]
MAEQKPCPICGKLMDVRGLRGHMKFAHEGDTSLVSDGGPPTIAQNVAQKVLVAPRAPSAATPGEEFTFRDNEDTPATLSGTAQCWWPFLGGMIAVVLLALLLLAGSLFMFVRDPDGTKIVLGFQQAVFRWIVVAGAAGGTVWVLRSSASRSYTCTSEFELLFLGLVHPISGAALGLAVATAFRSGVLPMPLSSPDSETIGGLVGIYTRGQLFLVLAAFTAGLLEARAVDVISKTFPGRQQNR